MAPVLTSIEETSHLSSEGDRHLPHQDPLKVHFFPRETTQVLEGKWNRMESECGHSVFTSWMWISSWLQVIQGKVIQCEVFAGSKMVGLGFFVEKLEYRFGIIPFRRLFLHRTGDHSKDRMCIEWNDLLICPGFETRVRLAVIQESTRGKRGFDEVVFGFTGEGHDLGISGPGFVPRIGLATPSPWLNLEKVRDVGYDAMLSHGTRAKIKRSLRSAEALGKINLRFAVSDQEAIEFYREAGPLHIKRFEEGEPGRQSGYLNPTFVSFHEALIPTLFSKGNIEFVKIMAGDIVIAYMYFMIYRNVVYFYQSAINYSSIPKGQPGLLANYLCICEFAKRGYDKYDFLAGDSLYKRMLTPDAAIMRFFHYRKRTLKMDLAERYLAWKQKNKTRKITNAKQQLPSS
jgi:Acetyltransferase (GNAT) domain